MEAIPLELPGLLLLRPKRHRDPRGWLSETYRADRLREVGIDEAFVQENQSFSLTRGTVRGFHLQRPPRAQAKLVRAIAGRILDVALDLRASSPTFGRAAKVELDAEEGAMLYIPEGFGHAFCTLTDAAQVLYKASRVYAPEAEAGVLWNDPALGVPWPLDEASAVVSERDGRLPILAEAGPLFP